MRTDEVMRRLFNTLDKKGFIVHYYKAVTTNSCYMKVDYGLANSIRIADHNGKEKYHYRFNLMLNIDKSYTEGDRNYYCLNDFDKLVDDIIKFKNDQLDKYGFKYYEYMLANKKKINEEKSSWKYARNNDETTTK